MAVFRLFLELFSKYPLLILKEQVEPNDKETRNLAQGVCVGLLIDNYFRFHQF